MQEGGYSVYKHIAPNGKVYIGQTKSNPASLRWRYPQFAYKDCPKFLRAIHKYGWDNFVSQVIETGLSLEEANKLEQYYIKQYDSVNSGYNLQSGGDNFKHSSETIEKIRVASIGKIMSVESRKKMSLTHKDMMTKEYRNILSKKSSGWAHTDEAKKKISMRSKGNKYNLGRKASAETRAKMSISAISLPTLPCGHKRHNRYTYAKCNK